MSGVSIKLPRVLEILKQENKASSLTQWGKSVGNPPGPPNPYPWRKK